MHISDYLRLSTAIISSHKKQALMIIFIVSLPLILLVAFIFIVQGTESSVISDLLAPTNGKVLLTISIDQDYCQDNCNFQENLIAIQQNISGNNGQLLEANLVSNELGTFLQLPSLTTNVPNLPDNTIIIAATVETAAKLIDFKLPERGTDPEPKFAAIEAVKEAALQKAIITNQNEAYYLAAFLPSDYFAYNLSFSSINQDVNLLDLLLTNVRTASSTNLIFGEIPASVPSINSAEAGIIVAEFPDIQSASKYFYSDINYCSESDHMLENCNENYRYQVSQVVGSPIIAYHHFQEIWSVLLVFIIVICIIESIAVVSTYVRLIDKDTKTISLYYTMGATKAQIINIYIFYLLILSLLAVVLAILFGALIALIINCTNVESLAQSFTLYFIAADSPRLIAWNWSIAAIGGFILVLAPLSVLLSLSRFNSKNLNQNLKS